MSEKITVVAHATAKKGKDKELSEVLQGLVAPTRAEKGCLNYDLHQSIENPCAFVFHENWTSQTALDAHLKTSHIAQATAAAQDFLVAPVQITLWKQI